ncbi:MAG: CehA/McbA family metallohydrolase [Pseudonocardia sp.]|nr:CehA/McbA family metallohydrolase [Pseudonocardia sp.]
MLELPPAVIEMLVRYRRMRDEHGFGWGEEALPDFFQWARFSRLGPAFDQFAATGDWAQAVRAAVGDAVPAGLVLVSIAADGGLSARTGPARPVIVNSSVQLDVVVDSGLDHDVVVTVAGQDVAVAAGGAGLCTLDLDADAGPITVACADARLEVTDAVVARPAAVLRLTSQHGARWSVLDSTGGAWFADGVPRKWDAHDQPFFHTDPGTIAVAVPAESLRVTAARGIEFERQEFELHPGADEIVDVDYRPRRRFDPVADGWYGADLHVHLNYSGDYVVHPADAARMQRGEGLHLMHLAAGNLGGSLVYDLETLEATAGTDLWSGQDILARAGLEFRNDLFGHVHGLGLRGVPELLHTGHEGTDHPWDWPPNDAACAQMQELGAVTTYAHPVHAPGDHAEDDPAELFRPYRMVEARELVADAALGVVDAIELVSCFDDRGALVLYHHLLSCGLRLAATAGTDTFLSFAHGPAPASNPPGWGRVYAQLGDGLSVEAFTEAVRAGRTVVTNGPWLTVEVDGHGPGAILNRRPGDRLRVRARTAGSGVQRLVFYGPSGELATTDGDVLEHEVVLGEAGCWLAAAAHGQDDPHTVGAPVFAHASPIYVDLDGRRVANGASARWCLNMLDGLQELATGQGRFDPQHRERQLGDLVAVLDRAREVYRAVERNSQLGTGGCR